MQVRIHLEIQDKFYQEYDNAIEKFCESINDFCTNMEIEEIGE